MKLKKLIYLLIITMFMGCSSVVSETFLENSESAKVDGPKLVSITNGVLSYSNSIAIIDSYSNIVNQLIKDDLENTHFKKFLEISKKELSEFSSEKSLEREELQKYATYIYAKNRIAPKLSKINALKYRDYFTARGVKADENGFNRQLTNHFKAHTAKNTLRGSYLEDIRFYRELLSTQKFVKLSVSNKNELEKIVRASNISIGIKGDQTYKNIFDAYKNRNTDGKMFYEPYSLTITDSVEDTDFTLEWVITKVNTTELKDEVSEESNIKRGMVEISGTYALYSNKNGIALFRDRFNERAWYAQNIGQSKEEAVEATLRNETMDTLYKKIYKKLNQYILQKK